MQLDRTKVAVRERGFLELCDLALRVMVALRPVADEAHKSGVTKIKATTLFMAFLVGVLPFALLNFALLYWMPQEELGGLRYAWIMLLLVFLETPLATVPATIYLGDAMFMAPPSIWQVLKTCWTLSGRLFVVDGLLRGTVVGLLLCLTLNRDDVSPGDFFLPLLVCVVLLLRSLRPYVNEIILLERNPLISRDRREVTIGRRSSWLHNPNSADLFARYIGTGILTFLLWGSLIMAVWFAIGTVMQDWSWGVVMLHVVLPGTMWAVACYFAVVRFLSYLDLRIRREGWAVELKLRAEAARLERSIV